MIEHFRHLFTYLLTLTLLYLKYAFYFVKKKKTYK
jgi:hypothetical protein